MSPYPSESHTDNLAALRAISAVFLVVMATAALIGMSPDHLARYSLASAALDSLPPYPCESDTARDPRARTLASALDALNAAVHLKSPVGRQSVLMALMPPPDASTFSSMAFDENLVPMFFKVELPQDRSVGSLVTFLEAVRRAATTQIPNPDSLKAYAYSQVRQVYGEGSRLDVEFVLAEPDSLEKFIGQGRVRARVRVRPTSDSSFAHSPRKAAWRDSFLLEVPADSAYLTSVQQCAWAMRGYFERHAYLASRPGPRFIPHRDVWKHLIEPLSLQALAPIDRVKPVLLEVAETDVPGARHLLREKIEDLSKRGSISVLGLSVSTELAAVVVPLICLLMSALSLFHLMNARRTLATARPAAEYFPWAPIFPGWTGQVSGFALYVAFPVTASALLINRLAHGPGGASATFLVSTSCVASVCAFGVLVELRRRIMHEKQGDATPELPQTQSNRITLYGITVSQLAKYNAVSWQAPALVVANIALLETLTRLPGLISVMLAVFNGAIVYSFIRMAIRQGEVTRSVWSAEKALRSSPELSPFVPEVKPSPLASRWVVIAALMLLDLSLLTYGLMRIVRGPW